MALSGVTENIAAKLTGAGADQVLKLRKQTDNSLNLMAALQVTLDCDEVLAIFHRHVIQHIEIDGMAFQHDEANLEFIEGYAKGHRASYDLSLLHEQVGTMIIYRSSRFDDTELQTFENLLTLLLFPLKNSISYRIAIAAAHYDPLTRIANRGAFDQAIQREVKIAERGSSELTLLVIDLDHFKRVNDRYGHLTGDAVLLHVASLLHSHLRGSDLLFRYGGEEFAALLQGTTTEQAAVVTERLHEGLKATPYIVHNSENSGSLSVTLSIGVAGFVSGDTPVNLFTKADKAVYCAKSAGRDQTITYQQ